MLPDTGLIACIVIFITGRISVNFRIMDMFLLQNCFLGKPFPSFLDIVGITCFPVHASAAELYMLIERIAIGGIERIRRSGDIAFHVNDTLGLGQAQVPALGMRGDCHRRDDGIIVIAHGSGGIGL